MPLRSRVLEGVQKKASAQKIVEAVRRKFNALRSARTALGSVSNEELDAASTVLEAGVKPAQLTLFKGRQKGREALEAFTVWADLIYRGVPGEEASSAITKLWQDGADDATFHSLWNNVQADISQGLNPGAALQNRIRETPARTATPQAKQPPEGQENQRSRRASIRSRTALFPQVSSASRPPFKSRRPTPRSERVARRSSLSRRCSSPTASCLARSRRLPSTAYAQR
jgi:hypothetical protein